MHRRNTCSNHSLMHVHHHLRMRQTQKGFSGRFMPRSCPWARYYVTARMLDVCLRWSLCCAPEVPPLLQI